MSRTGCECSVPTIEHDSANGIAFCTKCGTVLEENVIVAEVQFVEGGDGRHMALGSRVSASGRNSGYPGRPSSESSAAMARDTIMGYATALNCNVENVVEIANRIYNITHNQGLTKGRQVSRVCAVCLYIALRKEKTPVMLIELADLLKVSVFKLGTLFMLIRRQFPDDADVLEIDPSIYIARFAAMLHFGAKTKDVANDAMKLVRRMKRDWLADGRRPAGICGACLLIAARMHNFQRSVHDIVNIVKMSGVTVKTRLKEFTRTPAASLTPHTFRDQFDCDTVDTALPPIALGSRKRKRSPADEITEALDFIGRQQLFDDNTDNDVSLAPALPPSPSSVAAQTPGPPADPSDEHTSLSDLDNDEDIANVLVTPEELSVRTSIWDELNKDYLLEKAEREARKSQVKPRTMKPKEPPASTIAEAVQRVAAKKISKKINQSMVSELFGNKEESNDSLAPAAEIPYSREEELSSIEEDLIPNLYTMEEDVYHEY